MKKCDMTKHKHNNNRKIFIFVVILFLMFLGISIYFGVLKLNENKEFVSSKKEEKVIEQNVDIDVIKLFEEKGIITGIRDMKVAKDTEVNLVDFVVINKDYVKSVVVDDSKVNYNEVGEYKVVYVVTFYGEKLRDFLKNEDVEVTFDTKGDTIIIKVTATVVVVDEETVKEEIEKGNEVITNNTKDKIVEENKSVSASNGNTNATGSNSSKTDYSGNNSSSNSSNHAHDHIWIDHIATKQVWVENWVDVPDYETKTIYGARFYIANSDGSFTAGGPTYWFENGFTQDNLKAIISNALKNGNNGVLNGVYYGNYQNVTKTERVQVGSHKEDQGFYNTQSYVDYQYCSACGVKR